jgi:hypothetical protein
MTVEDDALAAVDEIVELYNNDDIAGVVERYWANTTVTVNGRTIATSGQDVLAGELAVLAAAPDRKLRITNAVANGKVIAVEATLSFTDRASGIEKEAHWSAFWTFADDGSITTDNAYFDPADWPAVSADRTTTG